MKSLAVTLAAIGLAGAAFSPALAGTTDGMTIKVPTADINLATAEGQKTLDKRIEKAVRNVCGVTTPSTGSRILSEQARDCLAKARADVKQQLAVLNTDEQRGG